MAHNDTLMFLTNVTWTFFLFISIYLFFVLLFLPSFFKKSSLFMVGREILLLDSLYALSAIPATLSYILHLPGVCLFLFRVLVFLFYSSLKSFLIFSLSESTVIEVCGVLLDVACTVFGLNALKGVVAALWCELDCGFYFSNF